MKTVHLYQNHLPAVISCEPQAADAIEDDAIVDDPCLPTAAGSV